MTVTTADPTVAPQDLEDSRAADSGPPEESLVEEDLLVEDVSIDGMCGVY